eukprot:gene30539-35567_t
MSWDLSFSSPLWWQHYHDHGSLLVTGTTVSVGSITGTYAVVVSAISITCVAPPQSAGSYAVVVTNPDTGYRAATDGLLTYAAHSGSVIMLEMKLIKTQDLH